MGMDPNDKDDGFDTESDTTAFHVRARPRGHSPQRHLLVCTEGPEIGRVLRLGDQPLTVGRQADCGLRLDVKGVSRQHARIRRFGEHYVLEDEGSANGTWVGGEQVTQRLLDDGDVIEFGPSAAFRYTVSDEHTERMLRALFEQSQTDTLTGVGNRRAFDTRLALELEQARRYGHELAVLLVDIDRFKAVNDTWGHAVGDEVLREVAERMAGALRTEDRLARYGGEEFAVLLKQATPGQVHAIAERLRAAVAAEPFTIRGLAITVSAGAAHLAEAPETGTSGLLARADRRLYLAKESGRNRVVSGE